MLLFFRKEGLPALKKTNPGTAPLPNDPTPLTAFGGWPDAGWFADSILSDPAIVAFELPRLDGLRKQGFHIIDRALTKAPPAKPGQELQPPPRRTAGKLAQLIDGYGALRALASCRSRLLFESGPVLFFADIPSARLKPRAATRLRRSLLDIGLRACVVRIDAAAITLMFWPQAEAAITDFVAAAAPDHPPHPEFDAAPPARAAPANRPAPARTDADKAARARETRLLKQIATLQTQIEALTAQQSALGALEQLGLDDARLKSMLKLLHPDKHANSQAATDAAQWVNAMRDLLKGKAAP